MGWQDAPEVDRRQPAAAQPAWMSAPEEVVAPEPESGFEQFIGGVKHSGKKAYRGVKGLVGGDTSELDKEAEEYAAKEKGGWATAGEIAGDIGIMAPLALVPGGIGVQAALAAGAGAAMTPGGAKERLTAGAFGAGGAGAGHLLTKAVGRLANPIGTKAADTLALERLGVEPTFGQAMAQKGTAVGRGIGGVEEAFTSLPLAGAPTRAARERAMEQWRGASRREAMPPGVAAGTPARNVDEVTEAVGKAYDDILDPVPMPYSSVTYQPDLRKLTQGLAVTGEQRQMLGDVFEGLRLKHLQNPAPGAPGGNPTAAAAQRIESVLKTQAAGMKNSSVHSEQEMGKAMGELADEFGNTWRGSLPKTTRDEIAALDRQYPSLKAIQQAAKTVGAQASDAVPSQYTPRVLSRAARTVDRSVNKRNYIRGEAPEQEMARLGQTLQGRLPDSGTATRSIVGSSILSGSLLGGITPQTAMAALTIAGYGTRPIQQFLTGRAAPALQQRMMEILRSAAPLGAQAGGAVANDQRNEYAP